MDVAMMRRSLTHHQTASRLALTEAAAAAAAAQRAQFLFLSFSPLLFREERAHARPRPEVGLREGPAASKAAAGAKAGKAGFLERPHLLYSDAFSGICII